MNLIIDTGNTFTKLALFKNGKLVRSTSIVAADKESIKKFADNETINNTIVCSVGKSNPQTEQFLKENFSAIFFDHTTPLPIKNLYQTPETLGKDRLAAAVGGWQRFRNMPVLVVDAGTCIKYDFVNDKGEYLGGAISLGIEMRFKALHTFTARLPLLETKQTEAVLTGKNTTESILSGVLNGTLQEVKGIIQEYKERYAGLTIIITGGSLPFFDNALKNSIFAAPNLVLEGLNEILEYNA